MAMQAELRKISCNNQEECIALRVTEGLCCTERNYQLF